jgi:hypothetical protein
MSLEISTTVRFVPDKEKLKPELESTVKVKSKSRKEKTKKKV